MSEWCGLQALERGEELSAQGLGDAQAELLAELSGHWTAPMTRGIPTRSTFIFDSPDG